MLTVILLMFHGCSPTWRRSSSRRSVWAPRRGSAQLIRMEAGSHNRRRTMRRGAFWSSSAMSVVAGLPHPQGARTNPPCRVWSPVWPHRLFGCLCLHVSSSFALWCSRGGCGRRERADNAGGAIMERGVRLINITNYFILVL